MRRYHIAGLVLASLLVAGCGAGSDTSQSTAKPVQAVSEPKRSEQPTTAQAVKQTGVWFVPAGLRACAKPEKVMVYWDARSFDGVKTVEIIAVNKAGKEALYLSAGRAGSRESGPWMLPGSQMILRDKANGTELARAAVDSIPCD